MIAYCTHFIYMSVMNRILQKKNCFASKQIFGMYFYGKEQEKERKQQQRTSLPRFCGGEIDGVIHCTSAIPMMNRRNVIHNFLAL